VFLYSIGVPLMTASTDSRNIQAKSYLWKIWSNFECEVVRYPSTLYSQDRFSLDKKSNHAESLDGISAVKIMQSTNLECFFLSRNKWKKEEKRKGGNLQHHVFWRKAEVVRAPNITTHKQTHLTRLSIAFSIQIYRLERWRSITWIIRSRVSKIFCWLVD